MKISDKVTPFFEITPLFYEPLPFYGKNLNPVSFLEKFESSNHPL